MANHTPNPTRRNQAYKPFRRHWSYSPPVPPSSHSTLLSLNSCEPYILHISDLVNPTHSPYRGASRGAQISGRSPCRSWQWAWGIWGTWGDLRYVEFSLADPRYLEYNLNDMFLEIHGLFFPGDGRDRVEPFKAWGPGQLSQVSCLSVTKMLTRLLL